MLKMTLPALAPKNVPANSIYTGNRAEQLIRGLIRILSNRSRSLSKVRVAMIAGALQPKPMSRGINDLPCSPMMCITLSMIKAALAK